MNPSTRLNVLLQTMLLIVVTTYPTVAADEGYLQVTGPCSLSFPADHGPHPDYRTEWWYYTGNLTDAKGRPFGFQLTFFRSRLTPSTKRKDWPRSPSKWRTDQIVLAHAAISHIDDGHHLQSERMARPVLSLSGAQQSGDTTTIFVGEWQAIITPGSHHLRADADDFSLDLDLTPAKAPVMHGENGYSRKGQSPERASCYYSFTRLNASGKITVAGRPHAVSGLAWMDHEFSTSPLQPGITGWDWFSLQLDDHMEIMIFLLRQADGTLNPASSGTFVSAAGETRHLSRDEIRIQPLSFWTSPTSRARYPVKWQMAIFPLALELTLTARLDNQEMRTPRTTRVTYWEGSVQAKGSRREKPIAGVGYVELTGYAEPFDAPM